MNQPEQATSDWKTKPTDRFILKWIKINLSSRITLKIVSLRWLSPWMITLLSTCFGVLAGVVFAAGWGWIAAFLAAFAQVMDGVDGQFSRLTGMQSKGGAFLDSVLDRYADAALMIGLIIYLIRLPAGYPLWLLLVTGFFALCGSSLVSYTTARAENLRIQMGKPTLASKGTRTSIIALCGWASVIWPSAPLLSLGYLAVHPNIVVMRRIFLAHRHSGGMKQGADRDS